VRHKILVTGAIVPSSYGWYYDWLGIEYTTAKKVGAVLAKANPGDEVDVYINSPGGVIDAGSEIYTLLREAGKDKTVRIHITGEACSSASIIAMAGWCEMSPTAMMMIHCTSSSIDGNHADMEKMAEVLRTADDALASAYVEKTGMSKAEVLQMMEATTWMTAEQAKEKGLIDRIMFTEDAPVVDGPLFELPTEDQMAQVKALLEAQDNRVKAREAQARLNLLRLTNRR